MWPWLLKRRIKELGVCGGFMRAKAGDGAAGGVKGEGVGLMSWVD